MNTRLKHVKRHLLAKKRASQFKCELPAKCVPCVYFIRSGQFVKIGVAWDVEKRLFELQVGNPVALVLVAVVQTLAPYQDEERLHVMLNDYRVRGEWFKLTDEQVRAATKPFDE